jgi:hypothetical protein
MASISSHAEDDHPDFQLLSAMRYDATKPWTKGTSETCEVDVDSPIMLLRYHRDRMADAARAFGWNEAFRVLTDDNSLGEMLRLAEEAVGIYCRENGQEPNASTVPYKVSILAIRVLRR